MERDLSAVNAFPPQFTTRGLPFLMLFSQPPVRVFLSLKLLTAFPRVLLFSF